MIGSIGSMSQTSQGSIGSGVYGSGVFPFSLFLFIIANIMFFKELVLGIQFHIISRFAIFGFLPLLN